MIDISNELYTLIANTLAEYDNKIGTSSVYTNTPSDYPFVSVEEIENFVNTPTSDSCCLENHAEIQFEINIYTKDPLKRSKAYDIAKVIDDLLASYNIVRVSKVNFQDPNNETIYRVILRYQCIVSKDHTIYRR